MAEDKEANRQAKYNVEADNQNKNDLIRNSFLIGREQNEILNELKDNSHESKSYFVRQALDIYFKAKDLI
jgi:hypothetical protein